MLKKLILPLLFLVLLATVACSEKTPAERLNPKEGMMFKLKGISYDKGTSYLKDLEIDAFTTVEVFPNWIIIYKGLENPLIINRDKIFDLKVEYLKQ